VKQKNPKEHTLQKFIWPHMDKYGQWWWGYQKVRINVLPESEKQKFIDSFDFNRWEKKDGD
jgi:hypothetical protein